MFNILNNQGHIVDTATSFPQASDVIVHLDRGDKTQAPHTCKAA